MGDPWELLDKAMNVVGLIELVSGGIAFVIWKRGKLKRLAAQTARTLKIIEPPHDVVVQMKPANIQAHALRLKAKDGLSALDKFLDWYLRIATS